MPRHENESIIDYLIRLVHDNSSDRVIEARYDGEGVPYLEPESDIERERRLN